MICDNNKIEAWAFTPNNVLSWEDNAGNTAWLLFMPLPDGAVLMGNVLNRDERMHPPSKSSISSHLCIKTAHDPIIAKILTTAVASAVRTGQDPRLVCSMMASKMNVKRAMLS